MIRKQPERKSFKLFPEKGMDKYELLEQLIAFEKESHFTAFEQNLFDEGPHLVSSPALPWGDAVRERVDQAYVRFMHAQIWHTGVGARKMEKEVISMMGEVLGNSSAAGFITSGGSESNICALIAAKARAFCKEFPQVDRKNYFAVFGTFPLFEKKSHSVVLPFHSHYSFYKGCAMLGLTPIPVPPLAGSHYQVDLKALRAAIREDTIAMIGTAGTWPYGTIDPIREMGEIAAERDLYFHVDGCFGGFIIPFLELSGYYDPPLPPWDFRVPTVASISADLHKNGMVPPPASSLYFRDRATLEYARLLAVPFGTVSGTRGTGSIAAAWTMLKSLGLEGYIAISNHSMELRRQLHEALSQIDGIKLLPGSKINLTVAYSEKYDLRPVVKALHTKTHWSVVTEGDPSPVGVCICTMPQNDGQIQGFAAALKTAIAQHAVPIGSLPEDYDFNLYGLDFD